MSKMSLTRKRKQFCLFLEDEFTTCNSSESMEKFEQDMEEIELSERQVTKLLQKVRLNVYVSVLN